MQLAAQLQFAQVNALRITEAAGLPEYEFERQFADLDQYLLALHDQFQLTLRARMAMATRQAQPGMERLKRATETYLDVCLEYVPLRSWLAERGHSNRTVAKVLRQRSRSYVQLITFELAGIGWLHAAEAAQLFVAMNREAALAEHQARRKLPEYRAVLWDFLANPPPSA